MKNLFAEPNLIGFGGAGRNTDPILGL